MNIDYWVWLSSKKGIGSIKIQKLLDYFKSPKDIYKLKVDELEKLQFLSYVEKKILADKDISKSHNICEKCDKDNINIITIKDKEYPFMLKHIFNPPILLYKKGRVKLNNKVYIAIVGSRKATDYGKNVAYNFSKHLSKFGISIVSGMARGIDTYAHQGAIDSRGETVAVLGCGPDIIYPRSNQRLMTNIEKNGCIISEYQPGVNPSAKNFPVRNRIISGMCLGVLVVEAEEKSGSLITANYAVEQSREVFAVPGNISSRLSDGTNGLIKQGAKPVKNIDDILEEIEIYLK